MMGRPVMILSLIKKNEAGPPVNRSEPVVFITTVSILNLPVETKRLMNFTSECGSKQPTCQRHKVKDGE